MLNVFENGKECSLEQVLMNKEKRVKLQNKILNDHPNLILAAIKLNIPGSIKNSLLLTKFFKIEMKLFERFLQEQGIIYKKVKEKLDIITGPESFYLLDTDFSQSKKVAISFENSNEARRLLDIDILKKENNNIKTISRQNLNYKERDCLLCHNLAKECARARKHSISELKQKINELITAEIRNYNNQKIAQKIAHLGIEAMIDEVITWPKPGLVDPIEHGAHPDMDQFIFIKSALSLENYLYQCASIGINYKGYKFEDIFEEIRTIGKKAEKIMFEETGEINTHKGVIFSLGIVTTAVGIINNNFKFNDLQMIIKKMTINILDKDLKLNINKKEELTAGEEQYKKYHLGGIREEAMHGYPVVFKYGLQEYQKQANLNQNDRNVMTLMKIARYTKDSTLIKRAKTIEIINWKNNEIDKFFSLGGINTKEGRLFLNNLQEQFSKNNLSLGGSADLLVVTLFIAKVKEYIVNGN